MPPAHMCTGKLAVAGISPLPLLLQRFQRGTMSNRYHGIVPDTFVDNADVVVEGRLAGDGTFEAHTLLAKCPSKYEAADGTVEEMPGSDSGEPSPH